MLRRKSSKKLEYSNLPEEKFSQTEIKKRIKKCSDKELKADILSILKGKIDVNYVDLNNKSILMRIIDSFQKQDAQYLIKAFISGFNDFNHMNKSNRNLLMEMLVNYEKVESLEIIYNLIDNTDLNVREGCGRTALICAIVSFEKHRSVDILFELIDRTRDINVVTPNGVTALGHAISLYSKIKSFDVIKRLMERTTVDFVPRNKCQILKKAISEYGNHQDVRLIKLLIESSPVDQSIIVHIRKRVSKITDEYFDQEILTEIIKQDQLTMIAEILPSIMDRARTLDIILNLDEANDLGLSILLYAIKYKSILLINELIELGANIQTTDTKMTPLEFAIEKNDYQIVKLLLDAGADPNLQTKPTSCLCQSITGFSIFNVKNNGEKSLKNRLIPSKDIIKILIDKGAKLNYRKSETLETPLILCMNIRDDWFGICELLLKAGADPMLKDHTGLSAISQAVIKYSKDNKDIKSKEFIDLFFEGRKVDTSVVIDGSGNTLMHLIIKLIALKQLQPIIILKLKKKRSKICTDVKNVELQTPIDMIEEIEDEYLKKRLFRDIV